MMIAMAISCQPRLLIADEPTTALDVTIQAQIVELVKRLQRELGMAVIWITHDLGLVARVARRICVMYAGKIVELGPSEKIYTNPAHPYTRGLMASIPRIGGTKELSWIPGFPPDLRSPPPACRFHPRCPLAVDVCRREGPPMVEIDEGRRVACWLVAKK